jgi:hypothetical protein
MRHDNAIASLRSRVSALVDQEGLLLSSAFELSRGGGERRSVDDLFARVQSIQVERNRLQKEIGNLLGSHRMHAASEVWRPGVYEYRQEAGGEAVHVRVTQGPLGLQVLLPGRKDPVRIETLDGSFDGPLAVDEPAIRTAAGSGAPAKSAQPGGARKERTAARRPRKEESR